jgi:hypothetical protein
MNTLESGVNLKKILLFIPHSATFSDSYHEWTPEETELILNIGSAALLRAKCTYGKINHKESLKEMEQALSRKYEEEMESSRYLLSKSEKEAEYSKERIRFLQEDTESQIERRLAQSKDIYDKLLDSYRKEREEMQQKISILQKENDTSGSRIQKDALSIVGKELESMRLLLKEKDKQIDTHKEMFEKSISKIDALTQKRDVASIGKIGEGQFRGLAVAVFRDFDGFQMKDVHTIGGLGDFHLQFKEMTILVDSKLYTNKVSSTSRDKIKRDLLNNEHIEFAWLVSMDTYVDRFDKAPFMFEWVNSRKCICYVNNLRGQEEPGELLRSVWFCCKALKQMMTSGESEKGELSLLKERELKIRDIAKRLEKSSRERDTIFNQMRQNFDKSDEFIKELMNAETHAVVNDYRAIVEWWNKNMEECPGEILKSTAIWSLFKKEPGQGPEMDANTFKDILCGFLGEDKVVKPKTKAGALEIRGFKWRKGITSDVKV